MNRGAAAGLMAMMGGGLLVMGLAGMGEEGALGLGIGMALFGGILLGIALYVFFGSSQKLKNWDTKALLEEQRMEAQRREEERRKEERRSQGLRGMLLGYSASGSVSTRGDNAAVSAAQISALSNPETARALQELQKLLYTQAISDQEFQAAKDKLLRSDEGRAQDDAFEHLQKLVELHEAGILNDVEFAAAKLKALGL